MCSHCVRPPMRNPVSSKCFTRAAATRSRTASGGPERAAQYVQAHMRPVNALREHLTSVTRTRIWPPRMRSWDEWKKLMEAAEVLRIDLKFTLHRSSSLAFKRPED